MSEVACCVEGCPTILIQRRIDEYVALILTAVPEDSFWIPIWILISLFNIKLFASISTEVAFVIGGRMWIFRLWNFWSRRVIAYLSKCSFKYLRDCFEIAFPKIIPQQLLNCFCLTYPNFFLIDVAYLLVLPIDSLRKRCWCHRCCCSFVVAECHPCFYDVVYNN